MDFTVFYAWQSDRPENTNLFLVRDAAKAAIKRLVKDSDVEESPRLDHDTKDVPGLAEVAGTIFRKIEGCGLFLADLTFVGTSERARARKAGSSRTRTSSSSWATPPAQWDGSGSSP